MRISVLVIGIALLLPACATDSKRDASAAKQIEWEPPVWSSETAETPEQPTSDEDWTPPVWSASGASEESTASAEPDEAADTPVVIATSEEAAPQSAPDTSIPQWSSDTTQTEPSGQDESPRWVSLASLLEGRIEHDLGATDRERIDDALKGLLEDDQSGSSMPWTGIDSSSHGRLVLASRYYADEGVLCGVVDHRHRIGDIDVGGSLTVCRDQTGDWFVRRMRWWSADETQSRSLESSLEGDSGSGSWQTLSDELAAPEQDEASSDDGNWSSIPE